ncbi:probable 3-beta-hydroxysteroid-delta(8),delta(7) -isomerase, partial [Tanacetum coccineum]
LTHLILESYFLFTPEFFKQKTPTYLAEVWKEYSKGDSRYIGRDSTVVAIEVITILLEGPACLLAAYAIATRKVYRHLLQIAVSLGQLYGTALYFITSYLDAGKDVDIGLGEGRDKPLRPDMLLYSWDGVLDVCVDLTVSSPLTETEMIDFCTEAYGKI